MPSKQVDPLEENNSSPPVGVFVPPGLIRQPRTVVERQLHALGLLTDVNLENVQNDLDDIVLNHSPASGESLLQGEVVHLTVSKLRTGPPSNGSNGEPIGPLDP